MATPTNDLIEPSKIRINWADFPNDDFRGFVTVTTFRVERSTDPVNNFQTIAYISGTTFTFTDIVLPAFPAATTYYYRTNAYNLLGWGIYSDNLVVLSDDYPGAAVSLASGTVEPKSILLTWTALSSLLNGRDAVTFYSVELYNSTTSMWEEKNSNDYNSLYTAYLYTSTTVFPASITY
jgi:hypothetical protein